MVCLNARRYKKEFWKKWESKKQGKYARNRLIGELKELHDFELDFVSVAIATVLRSENERIEKMRSSIG